MRVLSVVGNRPQFIKSAPLSAALREAGIEEISLHEPRYRLDLRQSDPHKMVPGIREAVERDEPDWVLVYGDTNSTLAGAQAAGATPVAHVEAGPPGLPPSMP